MRNLTHGAAALAVFSLLIVGGQVKAQNLNGQYDDSKFAVWFSQQYSEIGGWCCDRADGHAFLGNYDPMPDGTVILRGVTGAVDGAGNAVDHPVDIVIDATKVLDGAYDTRAGITTGGPNPTGHAILWSRNATLAADGSDIFCFSPGPLG